MYKIIIRIKSQIKALGFLKTFSRILKYSYQKITNLFITTIDENELCFNLLIENKMPQVMIDVGAHYGSSLRAFIDKNFSIYAFEPDPKNREILLGNFPLKKYKNLILDCRAVSDKVSYKNVFYTSKVSSGISGLSAFDESHSKAFEVDSITINQYILENNITSIDYLKIDTEGYDLNVLKGIDFNAIKPKVILCEFEDKKSIPIGYTWKDMARFLTSMNYFLLISEWYPIKKYGAVHKFRNLKRYPCDLDNENGWGNIIALKSLSDIKFIESSFRKKNKWKMF